MRDLRQWSIAICDRDESMRRQLREMVEGILMQKKVTYCIREFCDGQELLEKIKEMHLLFLQIEMPDFYNSDIGLRISRLNPGCSIIVESRGIECCKEAFKIGALRYLTKPFELGEVQEAINAYDILYIGNKEIEVFRDRNCLSVRQRDIQYIMAYGSYVELWIQNHTYRKETSLNALEEILDSRYFLRLHRQYIVNLFWITEYQHGVVYINNRKIPVARRRKKQFEKAYMELGMKYHRM